MEIINKNTVRRVRRKDKLFLARLIEINPNLKTMIEKFELVKPKTVKQ